MPAVADLFAKLGIKVDEASADKALSSLISQVRRGAEAAARAAAQSMADEMHFASVVLDTSRAARKGLEDDTVAWDGWNARAKEGTDWWMRLKKAALAASVAFGAAWSAKRIFDFGRGLVDSTTAAAVSFERMSQRTGVGVERFQQLAHAARRTGVDVDNFVEFLQDLQEKAFEAARGQKEYADAYRSLGVDVTGANGKLKSGEVLMKEVADRFAKMEDGGKKTAIAMKLFSDEGTKIIPLLNKGSAGIDELASEATRLGIVLDKSTIKRMKELSAAQTRVTATLEGLRNRAVAAILPALQDLLTRMQAWLEANHDVIRSGLTKFLRLMIAGLKLVGKTVDIVIDGLQLFSKHWKLVAAVVAGAVIPKLIAALAALKLASIRAAIASAASWVAAMLPLVLTTALIAGILLIAEDLWVWSQGGDSLFKRIYEEAREWMQNKLGGVFDWYEARMIELGLMKGKSIVSQGVSTQAGLATGRPVRRAGALERDRSGNFRLTSLGDLAAEGANLEVMRNAMRLQDQSSLLRRTVPGLGLVNDRSQFIQPGARRAAGPLRVNQTIGSLVINEAGDAEKTREVIRDELGKVAQDLSDISGARSVP